MEKEVIIYLDQTVEPGIDWNPDADYGNEYVSVHFRLETNGYSYPSFQFSEL